MSELVTKTFKLPKPLADALARQAKARGISESELIRQGLEATLNDDRGIDKSAVKRVLLHAGKIHWDLRAELEKNPNPEIALVRLEQYYPAPVSELNAVIDSYPDAELVWVQDEPENQGAWPFMALEVSKHLHGRTIRRVSRAAAASTATGSPKVHAAEQAEIMKEALTL